MKSFMSDKIAMLDNRIVVISNDNDVTITSLKKKLKIEVIGR